MTGEQDKKLILPDGEFERKKDLNKWTPLEVAQAKAVKASETQDAMKQFVTLEKERRVLESRLKEVKEIRDGLEQTLLERFQEGQILSVKVDGLTVYLHRQLWARPKGGDYDLAVRALREVGWDDLVEIKCNTHRVSSQVREMDREGVELPEPIREAFDVAEEYSIRTRKAS